MGRRTRPRRSDPDRFVVRRGDGTVGTLDADLSDLFVGGETGLMGLALSSNFAGDRTLCSCQGHIGDDPVGSADILRNIPFYGTGSAEPAADIRVVAWRADPGWTRLDRIGTVFTGIPVGAGGRHGGCRVLASGGGTLFVGTGDSAQPNVPQDPKIFGGKVLHITTTGARHRATRIPPARCTPSATATRRVWRCTPAVAGSTRSSRAHFVTTR